MSLLSLHALVSPLLHACVRQAFSSPPQPLLRLLALPSPGLKGGNQ